jgi:hypothetical protein
MRTQNKTRQENYEEQISGENGERSERRIAYDHKAKSHVTSANMFVDDSTQRLQLAKTQMNHPSTAIRIWHRVHLYTAIRQI